jgi:hypothetical protein
MRAVVYDQAEAIRKLQFFRDRAGNEEQMAQDCLIGGAGFADPWDHFLWNDQQVNGCLRLDVMQDDTVFVLVFDLRGNFAVDDFLKDRFGHGGETTKHTKYTKGEALFQFVCFVYFVVLQKQQLQIGSANGSRGGELADESERFFVIAFAAGGRARAWRYQGRTKIRHQKR